MITYVIERIGLVLLILALIDAFAVVYCWPVKDKSHVPD